MDDERRNALTVDEWPDCWIAPGGHRQHGRTGASDTPVHGPADVLSGGGMAGQKGMRPAPESLGGDHPAGRGTRIRNRGGIIMPMVPPLSYRPSKAAVQGVLMRERRQPPPPTDAFMLCTHQTMPSPHGRARCSDGEERQIERGGPALRLSDDGRREQREADDGVDGFSNGLHGGLLFLRCPRHASRWFRRPCQDGRRCSGPGPTARS